LEKLLVLTALKGPAKEYFKPFQALGLICARFSNDSRPKLNLFPSILGERHGAK